MNTIVFKLAPLWLVMLSAATCDSRSDYFVDSENPDAFCRANARDCFGEIGGGCDFTDDCGDGVCCRDRDNCGGGMCLYFCDDNRDCPSNTACKHGYCFFTCGRDADCSAGQECKHDGSVCEYD